MCTEHLNNGTTYKTHKRDLALVTCHRAVCSQVQKKTRQPYRQTGSGDSPAIPKPPCFVVLFCFLSSNHFCVVSIQNFWKTTFFGFSHWAMTPW